MLRVRRKAVLDAEQAQRRAESALEFERERYRMLEAQFQGQAVELEGLRQRNLEFAGNVTQFQAQLRAGDHARQDAQDALRTLEIQVRPHTLAGLDTELVRTSLQVSDAVAVRSCGLRRPVITQPPPPRSPWPGCTERGVGGAGGHPGEGEEPAG